MSRQPDQKSPKANNASDPAQHKNASATDPIAQPSASSDKIRSPESNKHRVDCKNENRHRLDYAIGIFAFIGAVAGSFAAGFGGWQAWIARDSEVVSNSAVIVANSGRFITYADSSEKPRRWQFTPLIENVGNTPTRNFRYAYAFGLCIAPRFEREDVEKMEPFRDGTKPRTYKSLIGPKAEIEATVIGLQNAAIDCPSAIASVGFAKFNDIFNRPHLVEFCYLFRLPKIDLQNFPIGQPVRVQGMACDHHNCSDEECGPDWKERAIAE
jgi:hypothetical protein